MTALVGPELDLGPGPYLNCFAGPVKRPSFSDRNIEHGLYSDRDSDSICRICNICNICNLQLSLQLQLQL